MFGYFEETDSKLGSIFENVGWPGLRSSTWQLLASFSFLAFAQVPTIANADHNWRGWHSNHIPVKLATDSQHGFSRIRVSDNEAERRLLRSISFLNTYLGSNAQFEYLGRGCDFEDLEGVVCVHAWNCQAEASTGCGTSQGCARTDANSANTASIDGWVRIVGGPPFGCSIGMNYSEYPWDVDTDASGNWQRGTEDTLVGLFNHELYHILGGPGEHTLPPQRSAINAGGSENPMTHYPSRWDIEGARHTYGSQTVDAAHATSSDASEWASGDPKWVGGRSYRFGSITYGAEFLGTVGTWYFDEAVYFKRVDDDGLSESFRIDTSESGRSFSPASIAYGESVLIDGALVALWLANETDTALGADIRVAVSFDRGETWPSKSYLVDQTGQRIRTTRKSVNIGFDPVSDRFVAIWHNNKDMLSYATIPIGQVGSLAGWTRGELDDFALDGASVACTENRLDDGDQRTNCLIIWTEMRDSYCMTWRQGSISAAGTFASSDFRTQCKDGWSAPSVTTMPNNERYDFVVGWMNPNTGLFSMRKPQERGTYWEGERQFSTAPNFTSPPSLGNWFKTVGSGDVTTKSWQLEMFYVRTP